MALICALIGRLLAHQRFNLCHIHRHIAGGQRAAGGGDDSIVLNANANVVEMLGHPFGGADIQARLNRHAHARLQRAAGAHGQGLAAQGIGARLQRSLRAWFYIAAAVVAARCMGSSSWLSLNKRISSSR